MTSEPTTPSSGSSQNIEYTLNPTDNLSSSTSYKVKVTTDAKDVLANPFASDYIHSHELKSSAILPASDAEVFFAVGQSGKIFRSGDNGATWDNETCFTFKQLNGVAYGSNTFVAAGNTGRIERSTDNGVTWSTSRSSGSQLNGIAFGSSTFAVVGQSGSIMTSSNGSSWNSRTDPRYVTWNSQNVRNYWGVAFGNNIFVAVGHYSKIIKSTNSSGSSWSLISNSMCNGYHNCYGYTGTLRGVAFGNGTFVAVGQSGRIFSSADNGASWDTRNSSGSILNGVAFGNGTFVAVGDGGRILTSSNLSTWNTTYSSGPDLNGVAFGNSTFVVVGDSGTILTSSNGSSWDPRTSGTTSTLNGVTFGE